MAIAGSHVVAKVSHCHDLLRALISNCTRNEPDDSPVASAELSPTLSQTDIKADNGNFAAFETASRNLLYQLIGSESIDSPAFGQTWILLDIITILSDLGYCEPGLAFWLIEELLDSQTIEGCKIVFDYLDTRRERLIAKSLIILRVCNELLRRLSRAENTVFCGRVFIFLFQSFPLGDRSSVNLRGEFHVENVTTFETPLEDMEVDGDATSMNQLYSQFWQLQSFFSQPTRLFEKSGRDQFRDIVAQTMIKFQQVQQEQQGRLNAPRGIKRRRSVDSTNAAAPDFNPKYLTSRDLFDLEVRDLAFRRHILVQVLILLDFLLSLSPKAKKKMENAPNKSVVFAFSLEQDDHQWATSLRQEIASYLQQGPEGKFYFRMVDTVLSRDKNWMHWKADGCPPIARDAVSAEQFAEAKASSHKTCTNKRLRASAMGTLDLRFLSQNDGIQKLQEPHRYTLPTLESFRAGVSSDAFDLEMARNDPERQAALDAKASKLWRAMRLACKTRLGAFDKLDGKDDAPLFDALTLPESEDESEPEVTMEAPATGDPSIAANGHIEAAEPAS